MTVRVLRSWRFLACAALWVPCAALASVGKVSLLQGTATRTPTGGSAVALEVGAEIELGDTIGVGAGSNLKIVLGDESLLLLGADSSLRIDEGKFQGLERRAFSARLLIGKVWAKVTRAVSGSDAKFEVTTDRAVAGVRGTVFRVDATKLLSAASSTAPGAKPVPRKGVTSVTTVKVSVGRVAVEAMVRNMAMGATPAPKGTAPGSGKKPRTLVAGPQEISKEQWEKKFVELQQGQAITVGEELWKQAVWSPDQDKDEFATFIAEAGR